MTFEEFFEEVVGISYDRLLNEDRIGFPAVTVSSEFLKPLGHGDVLEIAMEARQVGNTSVTFAYVVYLDGTPEVRARSEQTLVCVDMESFRPTSIPARCRDAFESILTPASETP